MTARLDAINLCLSGIGLAPFSDEDNLDLDGALAKSTVERISREIQQRGWYFNKEFDWNLVPDSNTGQVIAPANALSIVTTGASRGTRLALREGKLYDMVKHTYDISELATYIVGGVGTIQVSFIVSLGFNDLPPIAQTAISYTARRQFAQDLEVDERRWKFQKEDETEALSLLQREDMRNRKHNYLNDNPGMQLFAQKVGGLNSSRNFLSVFPRRNTY
jgi:hypothetical protein